MEMETCIDKELYHIFELIQAADEVDIKQLYDCLEQCRKKLGITAFYLSDMMSQDGKEEIAYLDGKKEVKTADEFRKGIPKLVFGAETTMFSEERMAEAETEVKKGTVSALLLYKITEGEVEDGSFLGMVCEQRHQWSQEEKAALKKLGRVLGRLFLATKGQRVQELLKQSRALELYNSLTLEYAAVFLINPAKNTYRSLRQNEAVRALMGDSGREYPTFEDYYNYYVEQMVYPTDKPMMYQLGRPEYIRENLEKKESFSVIYRAIYKDELIYCRVKMIRARQKEYTEEFILGFYNIDEECREKKALETASRTDTFTGLLNKQTFMNEVENYLKEDGSAESAMVFLDLDNLKYINDSFGHCFGDRVIKEVAEKLKKTFRRSDFVGRFGGDEFCIFLTDISREVLKDRLESLSQKLGAVYQEDEKKVKITVSMGAVYCENDGISRELLMDIADQAVYEVKEKGKNGYTIKVYKEEELK